MARHGVILVGCGGMARLHLEGLRELEGLELVGVVDLQEQRAKDFARQYKARSRSTDRREYLDREDCDIAIVATYPSSHKEIVLDFLEAGKHVLCEKPLAPTLQEAEEIISAVKATGKKLMIGYILRHNASYQKITQMISDGSIGFPIVMRMLGGEHPITDEHWRRDVVLATETSPIIDCGCHYVDVMRWLTGAEAVQVSGAGLRLSEEIPEGKYDYGIITVRMSDGSVGTYEVGWARNYRNFSDKEFIGPKGRIRLIYQEYRQDHLEEGDLIEYYSYPGHYEMINIKGELKKTGLQLQALVEMIEQDGDPMPGLEDAYKSLEIVLAGDEAIRTGKTIALH